LIGIVAGLLAQRFLRSSWLTNQFAGRRASVTHALVGIAGSFIGFHIGVLLDLGRTARWRCSWPPPVGAPWCCGSGRPSGCETARFRRISVRSQDLRGNTAINRPALCRTVRLAICVAVR